ncbi:radical SAM protein [Nitrospinae bacterium AH_259_B05_G02_I21]|nr:radical SAM protein [Nitrospinae bacterium AH_259_B05_G02_I21]MDA2932469.1 radical SAM protein [Nitrospinae bacterium AH-259-F20]
MGCTVFPEFNPEVFFDSLGEKGHKLRIPLVGSMELTDRCNLSCKHCYINLPANDRAARATELSTKEIFRIFDEITDAGCLWLLLSGGDPFLRPDFLDIYTYAKKKGLLVTIFTNGTMITHKIADYLALWPPRKIEITLYGMTEATYEAVTGLPGSYKKCIRGIELLHERGLQLKLKAVGLTINKHEIADMRAYSESLGLKGFKVEYLINPRLNGSKLPCNFRLDTMEIVEMQMADPEYASALQESAQELRDVDFDRSNLYGCGAGIQAFHIDSHGRLSLCTISRLNSYDLRQGSFAEGFNTFLLGARTKARPRDFLCNQCEIEYLCDHCPAQSELVHGVLDKPVEFLCELTHRQAAAIGIYPKNPVLDLRRLDRKKEQEESERTVIPLRVVA